MWKTGNAHRILAGKPEVKRSLWSDIKGDLKELVYEV